MPDRLGRHRPMHVAHVGEKPGGVAGDVAQLAQQRHRLRAQRHNMGPLFLHPLGARCATARLDQSISCHQPPRSSIVRSIVSNSNSTAISVTRSARAACSDGSEERADLVTSQSVVVLAVHLAQRPTQAGHGVYRHLERLHGIAEHGRQGRNGRVRRRHRAARLDPLQHRQHVHRHQGGDGLVPEIREGVALHEAHEVAPVVSRPRSRRASPHIPA